MIRLLLVEDEAHLAFTLELNLTQEGYQVDVAPTLHQARIFLRTYDYTLLVLDIMLPDGNGLDFCEQFREEGHHTPVLMLTAKGAKPNIIAGLEAGADDYLTKPFDLHELLSRIQALVRRQQWTQARNNTAPQPAEEDAFEFQDARVDFQTQQAHVRERTFELTALEARLLRFFFEREGQVISRNQLLTEVWGISPNTNTRTVDNFMVRLRRLFEADPSRPRHFVTIRGIGYRFQR